MKELYDNKSKNIMKIVDRSSSMSLNRIEQIRAFALEGNFKRIGIAHCITFNRETKFIKRYLEKDFEVFSVDCKINRLSSDELFDNNKSKILCNPAGQAHFLNEKNTDLNISLGLCVGHDMIFNIKSDALVTTLYSKDFTNNNDMDQAISDLMK